MMHGRVFTAYCRPMTMLSQHSRSVILVQTLIAAVAVPLIPKYPPTERVTKHTVWDMGGWPPVHDAVRLQAASAS